MIFREHDNATLILGQYNGGGVKLNVAVPDKEVELTADPGIVLSRGYVAVAPGDEDAFTFLEHYCLGRRSETFTANEKIYVSVLLDMDRVLAIAGAPMAKKRDLLTITDSVGNVLDAVPFIHNENNEAWSTALAMAMRFAEGAAYDPINGSGAGFVDLHFSRPGACPRSVAVEYDNGTGCVGYTVNREKET